ncbi:hypothetical protein [Pseudoxanthomonas wuyuanensis]|uniref:hypothetical protein n=1 Tax=Pseudoxanthomonas wuyuanensis TaxID=1073196 RepID=UPI000BE3A1FA|nr:hypothetical protein [Pseudoxanthomonas wuyuanensis]KAF1719420.1 hypothetical protein CSC75_15580 [Pseudoxanthomonas wuyuanensis]
MLKNKGRSAGLPTLAASPAQLAAASARAQRHRATIECPLPAADQDNPVIPHPGRCRKLSPTAPGEAARMQRGTGLASDFHGDVLMQAQTCASRSGWRGIR